jgi:tetratricopeptide (TPR) repeat protein
MIERHYDDEALISLIESQRATSDAHLTGCESCNEKLESFQMIAEALHDADVWDTRPLRTEAVPATIATLRAFADRTADEDTAAVAILAELLAGTREEWMPRLAEHPQWRTAGVVRGLIAGTSKALDTMPRDAVAITELATCIADGLDAGAQPPDIITRLRGAAWRENAYALFYSGQFTAAEGAFFVAERHFCSCSVADYELARLGIVRALVLRPLGRLTEASDIARTSALTFLDFGDVTKTVAARVTEAQLLFSRDEYAKAATLLSDVEQQFEGKLDLRTHELIVNNLAYCSRKLGHLDLALKHYDMVTAIFEELGVTSEAVRARWNGAAIEATLGRLVEAQRRFEDVVSEFDRLGMTSEAALANLDIAEILLTQGRPEEAARICRRAMASFERAGLSYTTRAMTALAFIQEASQQGIITPTLVRDVRDYIRRLPSQPNLLFAPSPSEFLAADFS